MIELIDDCVATTPSRPFVAVIVKPSPFSICSNIKSEKIMLINVDNFLLNLSDIACPQLIIKYFPINVK
ncbi:hypothetical protein GCM10008025_26430 [Ornithinibacillus halotolerans]|uniref:Uncharacterized protein n=1 Tax=Ornithinibacillus halotolerans TaxID=1274357 RepID=A0A916WA87_9BACI|nr:hypothetical protein GCM10008025_26430 [Ornithinibacillus halotolerans]